MAKRTIARRRDRRRSGPARLEPGTTGENFENAEEQKRSREKQRKQNTVMPTSRTGFSKVVVADASEAGPPRVTLQDPPCQSGWSPRRPVHNLSLPGVVAVLETSPTSHHPCDCFGVHGGSCHPAQIGAASGTRGETDPRAAQEHRRSQSWRSWTPYGDPHRCCFVSPTAYALGLQGCGGR